MVMAILAAVLYAAALCAGCGGLMRKAAAPQPVTVPAGRHAKTWPRVEAPFAEYDEWTRPLRKVS